MNPTPARAAALQVVRTVRERDAYAHVVLDNVLSRTPLPQDDAALATRLAYGTIQVQGTLDEALDRFLDRPDDLDARVRDALRVSAYELLFSRTPARAAVHQGVELARTVMPGASSLANAVLRRVASSAESFPWGDPDSDDVALARLTGHPLWLARLWVGELGRKDAAALMQADNEPAPLYLAHNPFRGTFEAAVAALDRDGARPGPGPIPGSITAGEPSRAVAGSAVAAGMAIVVDAAAQFAPTAIGSHPGGLVVDLAAGRGTKTLLVQANAVAAGAPADLFAVDIHPFKSRVLQERMVALGVPGVAALTGDATDPASVPGLPAAETADAVLVDAPCSGLGALRRHPEQRWRVQASDLPRLSELGSRLLASGASLVRPGGVVVYSTCTVAAAENSDVVGAFLDSAAGHRFRLRRLDGAVPEHWRDNVTVEGWFQSVPAVGGPDGHFVAAMERVE